MHKLPVTRAILQDSLEHLCEGNWIVGTNIVYNGRVMWTELKGLPVGCKETALPIAALKHLLKLRKPTILPGWSELPSKRKDEIYGAQRRKLKVSRCWPKTARTGAEYVEACEWYDRVEAELEMHTLIEASSGSQLDEIAGPLCLSREGSIPDEAFRIAIRQSYKAQRDEKKLREQFKKELKVEIAGNSIILHGHQHKGPEQPWERQARVAASAGYAHVAPEVDKIAEAAHLARVNHPREPYYELTSYAHTQPDTQLSGTRSINGWAVSGFAVTDGKEQFAGPTGETGGDRQRRKICGPTLEVQDACQRFYDEARQNGDASPRTRRQLAAALERRA